MFKKLSKNFNFFLALTAALFLIVTLLINGTSFVNYKWELRPVNSGDFELYIKGNNIQKVTVADIKFFVNSPVFNNFTVESGGFFAKPIISNITKDQLNYLIIKSPEDTIDTTKPMLIIHAADEGFVEVSPLSQIYISQKGVFYPKINNK